ncbi:hypothetical protein Scep_007901 [Stephania cephalantha]|uniref:Uncharacterized protein n=1 Tax=Stephania cephalantha TaxID=152367 RepID=A0AAP0KCF9_9MAGN
MQVENNLMAICKGYEGLMRNRTHKWCNSLLDELLFLLSSDILERRVDLCKSSSLNSKSCEQEEIREDQICRSRMRNQR